VRDVWTLSTIFDPAKCAPRRKFILELDGSQHLEQEEYDKDRTTFLKAEGYRFLRF
jgi:very-short-patch-repair endonuclease